MGHTKIQSNHQRCFMEKGVLNHFAKFTKKHLCQSILFNKVASLDRERQITMPNQIFFYFLH